MTVDHLGLICRMHAGTDMRLLRVFFASISPVVRGCSVLVAITIGIDRAVQRLARVPYVMRQQTGSAQELVRFSLPRELLHLVKELPHTEGQKPPRALRGVARVRVELPPELDRKVSGHLD